MALVSVPARWLQGLLAALPALSRSEIKPCSNLL